MKKLIYASLVVTFLMFSLGATAFAVKQGGQHQPPKKQESIEGNKIKLEAKNPGKIDARKEAIRKFVAEKRAKKDKSISVFVGGKGLKFDVPPVIKYGRTLIPVRAITNALGGQVSWDEATKTVVITKGETTITLTLGAKYSTVNGTDVILDVPAEAISNRTFVPIRFIAQYLKQKVEWDEENETVVIDEPTVEPTDPPQQTDIPEVTNTPEPTDVPEVTGSPEPTDVPEVTGSPEPTDVPEVTEVTEPVTAE